VKEKKKTEQDKENKKGMHFGISKSKPECICSPLGKELHVLGILICWAHNSKHTWLMSQKALFGFMGVQRKHDISWV